MNGREQVVAYAALYQPDVIAGFRIDDLVDVPTLGGCEVYRVDSAAVAHVENFNRGRSEMRLENSVEGRMILDSWTVRTVVLIPSVRARASGLIRERVQTLQPSPGRLGEIHTPRPCRGLPQISVRSRANKDTCRTVEAQADDSSGNGRSQSIRRDLSRDSWETWRAVLAAASALPITEDQAETFKRVARNREPPAKRVSEFHFIAGHRSAKTQTAEAIVVPKIGRILPALQERPRTFFIRATIANER